jgi:predicted PurR-regulated permease PerM
MPVPRRGREWVAIILALGLVVAVDLITAAVLYDAIFSNDAGLSENATQVLIAAFGGIIGVLGGYIGYQAGKRSGDDPEP